VLYFFLEGYPSGQRDQTVNLTAYAFEGSNPSPSKKFVKRDACGCSSMVELQPSKLIAWVRFPSPAPKIAHIAQSVEHFLGKEEVTGSIPVVGFGLAIYDVALVPSQSF
jgi:hypothetical protein